jgi:hypothetical protein
MSLRSPNEYDKLTLETKKSMIWVSKIYPRGIQYRNLNNVSRVALIKLGLFAFSSTSLHKLKISPNSAHMLCFNALVLACVICSAEKSKISSDRSLRMTMLFSQRDRDVREEATISGMKDGQSLGHACFRIWSSAYNNVTAAGRLTCTRTRLSLLRYPFSRLILASS